MALISSQEITYVKTGKKQASIWTFFPELSAVLSLLFLCTVNSGTAALISIQTHHWCDKSYD